MGQAMEILSEDSAMKSWAQCSDTQAPQAHFCPNIEPIYHMGCHTFCGRAENGTKKCVEFHPSVKNWSALRLIYHVAGEAALTEGEHAAYRLRVRLGLEAGLAEQQEQDQRPPPVPHRNQRIGQRKPTRDPIKKESAS
jgi:hypothetical protein